MEFNFKIKNSSAINVDDVAINFNIDKHYFFSFKNINICTGLIVLHSPGRTGVN